jgi:hypothetical protein
MQNRKIEELDEVALIVDLPQLGLIRGHVCTVVLVYPPDSFEVEFVDETGRTYGLATLNSTQLMRLHHKPIAA